MSKLSNSYDWAAAILALAEEPSSDIVKLAQAAQLDPKAGDMIDLDLRGLDLRGVDLSGWDLSHAKLAGANLFGTDLTDAKVDPGELLQADGWEHAKLDTQTKFEVELRTFLQSPIEQLDISPRYKNSLHTFGITQVQGLWFADIGKGDAPERKNLLKGPVSAAAFQSALKLARAQADSIRERYNLPPAGFITSDPWRDNFGPPSLTDYFDKRGGK